MTDYMTDTSMLLGVVVGALEQVRKQDMILPSDDFVVQSTTALAQVNATLAVAVAITDLHETLARITEAVNENTEAIDRVRREVEAGAGMIVRAR